MNEYAFSKYMYFVIPTYGASLAMWLKLFISNHWPLSAVGLNPARDRDIRFFYARNLSS